MHRQAVALLVTLVALAVFAAACAGNDPADQRNTLAAEVTDQEPAEPTEVPSTAPEPTEAPTAAPDPTATLVETPTETPTEAPTQPSDASDAADDTATDADSPAPAAVDAASGCSAAIAPGTTTRFFTSEDREREYELHVPDDYDPETPTALVLNWHGLGSNGPEQLAFSDYAVLADEHDFLVVAPTGIPGPGEDRNSWELADTDPTRDDLQFFDDLMAEVIATVCVDETRVYTTGMSNGGYFSARLICERADRIAAAASVAALYHPDDCEPSRPVPFIGFHGTDDETVPYAGGGTSSLLPPGVTLELFEPAIPDEFAEFVESYGCEIEATESSIGDDVTAFAYEGCPVEATFYSIADGGHTWPGSPVSLAIGEAVGLGVTTDDIVASEVSWEFFSRHNLHG